MDNRKNMNRDYTDRWGFYFDKEIDTSNLSDKDLQKLIQRVLDRYSTHSIEE